MVFRNVDDVHFSVLSLQVFRPSGCEKQSTFSFQNYTPCSLREKNSNYSTICNKRRCKHKQNSTKPTIGEEKILLPHLTMEVISKPKAIRNLFLYTIVYLIWFLMPIVYLICICIFLLRFSKVLILPSLFCWGRGHIPGCKFHSNPHYIVITLHAMYNTPRKGLLFLYIMPLKNINNRTNTIN